MPPDQKPEGTTSQWIPGYWAWDDESQRLPLGERLLARRAARPAWVPGHWQEVEGGWQWAPGFWARDQQTDVDYLPPPPPPDRRTARPPPAPDDNSIYVPGCWV